MVVTHRKRTGGASLARLGALALFATALTPLAVPAWAQGGTLSGPPRDGANACPPGDAELDKAVADDPAVKAARAARDQAAMDLNKRRAAYTRAEANIQQDQKALADAERAEAAANREAERADARLDTAAADRFRNEAGVQKRYAAHLRPGIDAAIKKLGPLNDAMLAAQDALRDAEKALAEAESAARARLQAAGTNCPPPPGPRAPFAEQPVPPLTGGPAPPRLPWEGFYAGAHVNLRFDNAVTREFWHGTGDQVHRLNDHGTNASGGIEIGFDRRVADNGLSIGVRVDVSAGDDEVRRTFPGGSYIGSSIDFTATLQGRVGMPVQPDVMVYFQGGLAVANQTVKIDFGGAETNTSRFTPGGIIGAGGEWMLPGPSPLGFGRAMSLFGEYSHTWWDSVRVNRPAASPSFDYTWRRQTDALRVGVRLRF